MQYLLEERRMEKESKIEASKAGTALPLLPVRCHGDQRLADEKGEKPDAGERVATTRRQKPE